MTTKPKPPLGLCPRHIWLHDRTRDCIDALYRLDLDENYDRYREKAKELATELHYAVTEWEKYYNEADD